MDRPLGFGLDRTDFVDRVAEHVHDAAERALADRHRDRLAGGAHFEAALEAVRRAERDRAHDAVAELLLDFQRQFGAVDLEGVVNGGNRVTREFTSMTAPMTCTTLPVLI